MSVGVRTRFEGGAARVNALSNYADSQLVPPTPIPFVFWDGAEAVLYPKLSLSSFVPVISEEGTRPKRCPLVFEEGECTAPRFAREGPDLPVYQVFVPSPLLSCH